MIFLKKLTRKQKKTIKKIFIIFLLFSLVSGVSYYFGKNDGATEDAKEKLGISSLPPNPPHGGGNKGGVSYLEQEAQVEPPVSEVSEEENSRSQVPLLGISSFPEESNLGISYELPDLQVHSIFPNGVDFGSPVRIGKSKFTYSDLKGLEISKYVLDKETVHCGNITEFLKETLNTWFYWNTCRSVISSDDGISFYVIRLSEDREFYIYEKHYVLYKKGLYGVYEVVGNLGVNKENIGLDIQAHNSELREKNPENGGDAWMVLNIVDRLFKKIIKV